MKKITRVFTVKFYEHIIFNVKRSLCIISDHTCYKCDTVCMYNTISIFQQWRTQNNKPQGRTIGYCDVY